MRSQHREVELGELGLLAVVGGKREQGAVVAILAPLRLDLHLVVGGYGERDIIALDAGHRGLHLTTPNVLLPPRAGTGLHMAQHHNPRPGWTIDKG